MGVGCLADRIAKESGEGTFGKVFLCEDTRREAEVVAIKVVRKIARYTDAARIEAKLLQDVNDRDPDAVSLSVRFYEWFEWKGHMCMVFEPLGPSLYDYLKANNYNPLPLYCVQAFADQLVTAVAFLHEMQLIHTDLKPENLLLVSRDPFVRVQKVTSLRDRRSVLAPQSTGIRCASHDPKYLLRAIPAWNHSAPGKCFDERNRCF